MYWKLQCGSATYTKILRYTTSLGVKTHSNRSMKFRQQGNRPATYNYHLTQGNRQHRLAEKLTGKSTAATTSTPTSTIYQTQNLQLQAPAQHRRAEWRGEIGQTTKGGLEQHDNTYHGSMNNNKQMIHESTTTKLTQIWNYKTTAYNYLYLQTRIK